MALIGKIRQNGWILIATMVLALGGFILMDIVSNSQNYKQGDLNTMGRVNGQMISKQDYDRYEKLMYSNPQTDPYQKQTAIWNYFVESSLVSQECEKLGLGVSKDELLDLEFSQNPANLSQIITSRFGGQTGQVDMEQLQQWKQAVETNSFPDPERRAFWAEQEKEIIKDRMQTKILGMVSKGIYTPLWQAEMAYRENNERIDFLYTRIPYDKVTDSEAPVTDADYKAYLADNGKAYFLTEETRLVDFVAVDVTPSAGDSAKVRDALSKIATDFRAAANDSAFVSLNRGTIDGSYKKKAALPPGIADTLVKLPVGTVVGPFLDGGQYNVAKILDRKAVPDSVKARHILIQTPTAEKTVDSLKNLVETNKARFDSLAAKFGTDATQSKGGDLGWFASGAMVGEFNDLCFQKAEQGKLYKVKTQFGWHLVEVTGKKFLNNDSGVKYAIISQRIAPGETTKGLAKDKAIQLATQCKNAADLTKKAQEMGLQMTSSSQLKANDYFFGSLGQGRTARDIVRWAFEEKTKKDEVRKDYFTFNDATSGFETKYVVTCLKAINPKGDATVDGVRQQIEANVKTHKKASVIMAKLGNTADIATAMSTYSVNLDTARGITMYQTFVPNGGNEPRVVGAAWGLSNGQTSKVIEGQSGVYLVKAIQEKPTAQMPPDMTAARRQVASTANNNVRMGLMRAWKKAVDVQDNRSRFF